jgi:hypothetical protein
MQQSFVRLTVGGQNTIGFVTPEPLVGEKKNPRVKVGPVRKALIAWD